MLLYRKLNDMASRRAADPILVLASTRPIPAPANSFRCNTYKPPVITLSKGLTQNLTPLDTTLTKNRGEGVALAQLA